MIARIAFVPTLAFNILMEKFTSRNWYDKIDDTVILGALPFRSMTDQLVNEGVRGVVSMNEDYELRYLSNQTDEWSKVGVEFLQLSVTDIFSSPSMEKLEKGVNFINQFVSSGKFVYVHCKAGRSRSATLVGCYLINRNNWTPEQAIDFIRSKRSHILLHAVQLNSLKEYYERHVKVGKLTSINVRVLV
uniref:Phosphatidylglycerophosphatase and protein-tyrosine phosphatase 1 n=1 Tax=Lynceus sp. MCZ IZ 141354 TaxID=1930659 RepID=A0A9N6WRQ2_9CRUS|nr:EOG090X0GSS [Lynceus sp. MCZ IZ 141354]